MIIGTNFKLSSAKFLDDRQLCKDYATLIANTEGIIYPPGFEVFCEYENKYYQYVSDTNGGYIWEERKSGVSDGTSASIKDDTISEEYTWSSAHIDSMRIDLEALITQANDYVDEIDERMLFIEGKFQWFEYFDGSYNSLTDKPTIPTKVSELENDSEFLDIKRLELELESVNEKIDTKIDKEEDRTLISVTELERLSTVDNYNDTEIRQSIEELEAQGHTHINSDILNTITEEKINQWNNNTGVDDYNYIQNKPIIRVGDDSDVLLNFSQIIDEGMYIITAMVGEYKIHNELVHVKWADDDNVTLTIPNMFMVLNVNRTDGVWNIINELHYGVNKENGKISDTLTIGEDKIILDKEGNGWFGGKVSQEGIPTEDKDLATKGYADNKFATNERVSTIEKEFAKKEEIPSVEGLATEEYVNQEIQKIDVTDQLTDYAKKTELPTKTSQLTNDSGYLTQIPSEYVTETELNAKGYLTEHQDISGKADKTELHNHSNKSVLDGITASKVSSWDNKSNFDGNYNSLTNKPSIPSIEGLATKSYVNDKVDIDYESVLKFDTDAMIDYTIAIVGEVDENNVITLWSNVLSDGLYTLRYSNGNEYADIGTVFIGELMLTKIEATKVLTTYTEGDTLNTDDIIVKAFYNDGTSKNISDYTLDISSIKMDTPGNYQLIITYENMSTNITIKVQEKATIKGNLFVPSTCTLGKRISSSGEVKDQANTFLTDFIEIGECMSKGDTNIIHWSGFHLYKVTTAELTQAGVQSSSIGMYRGVAYYDATGKFLGQDTLYVTEKSYDSEGNYQLVLNATYTTATKIRIFAVTLPPAASVGALSNCKLTLNQLISEI